jgi:hypothetical protein
MAILRFYAPQLCGRTRMRFYCGGMAAPHRVISGNRLAEWALTAQLSLHVEGLERATLARQRAARARLGQWHPGARHLGPVATWVWLIAMLSSAFAGSIEWRGRRYSL